jgi:hypothetical protein
MNGHTGANQPAAKGFGIVFWTPYLHGPVKGETESVPARADRFLPPHRTRKQLILLFGLSPYALAATIGYTKNDPVSIRQDQAPFTLSENELRVSQVRVDNSQQALVAVQQGT